MSGVSATHAASTHSNPGAGRGRLDELGRPVLGIMPGLLRSARPGRRSAARRRSVGPQAAATRAPAQCSADPRILPISLHWCSSDAPRASNQSMNHAVSLPTRGRWPATRAARCRAVAP